MINTTMPTEASCRESTPHPIPFVAQKTILIERVSNGWIVRPFQPIQHWESESVGAVAGYPDMEKLQADLPKLIANQY
jgi:hypothetical protein